MSEAKRIVENLLDLDSPRPIVYSDKVIKDGILTCPHCNESIHEKGTYSDDGGTTMRHGPCGGVVQYKPPSEEERAAAERYWGRG